MILNDQIKQHEVCRWRTTTHLLTNKRKASYPKGYFVYTSGSIVRFILHPHRKRCPNLGEETFSSTLPLIPIFSHK